jgi:hypothetical protein
LLSSREDKTALSYFRNVMTFRTVRVAGRARPWRGARDIIILPRKELVQLDQQYG